MNSENLMRALRAVFELDVRNAPKMHRLLKPDCSSMGQLVEALAKGLSADL